MFLKFLFPPAPPRSGEVWTGLVARCADPLVVRWPDVYAVADDHTILSAVPLDWDDADECWRVR